MTCPKYIKHKNENYKKYIKTLPCLICLRREVDPHHYSHSAARGGNDYLCIPLCRAHHQELHSFKDGEMKWWDVKNINPEWEIINCLADYIDRDDPKIKLSLEYEVSRDGD